MSENENKSNGTPELVSSNAPSNVLNFSTGKPFLPKAVRAALMGQYVESKERGHTPEQFADFFEKRILSDVAYTGAKIIRDFFADLSNKE